VKRLRERARLAASMPFAGRVVPEHGREDIREVLVRSYRIIYRVQPDQMVVLTVLEGHRLLRPSMTKES
jgi:toxin ParE1/3/4